MITFTDDINNHYLNNYLWLVIFKESYDVAKKNINVCIWCNAMCLCGLRLKKHIILHLMYIIVAPLCHAFLKRSNVYKAHCSETQGVLWLASYPVHCDWPNTSKVRWKCYTPLYCIHLFLAVKMGAAICKWYGSSFRSHPRPDIFSCIKKFVLLVDIENVCLTILF